MCRAGRHTQDHRIASLAKGDGEGGASHRTTSSVSDSEQWTHDDDLLACALHALLYTTKHSLT